MRRLFLTFSNPWLIFLAWVALCSLFFYRTLEALVSYSITNDNSSHLLLIPLIVAWLFHTERSKLSKPAGAGFDIVPAMLVGLGAAVVLLLALGQLIPEPGLSLCLRAQVSSFVSFLDLSRFSAESPPEQSGFHLHSLGL